MNQRIRLLEKQCWNYQSNCVDTEKFAELIVKEMCGLMSQAEDDCYHCLEPAERPTEYIEWLADWQERFANHFGVDK